MSDFIHKAKIAELAQSNLNLTDEIRQLKSTIQSLNNEIERLRQEKPEDASQLKIKISEHEQREVELQERILLLSRETENSLHKSFFRTLVPFLLGILVSLIAWLIVDSIKNNHSFSSGIKQIFNDFLAL